MKEGRISQTALKVALALVTLSVKDDWAKRLPPGLVEVTEHLLMASGSPGYGPRLMRMSKQQWMIRVYQVQDLMMPGQFEGFGNRKIFMQQHVEAAIQQGARQVLVVGAATTRIAQYAVRLGQALRDLDTAGMDLGIHRGIGIGMKGSRTRVVGLLQLAGTGSAFQVHQLVVVQFVDDAREGMNLEGS